MLVVKYSDYRIALIETCDAIVKGRYRRTPLVIFKYVGGQKAYYVFGRRVKG